MIINNITVNTSEELEAVIADMSEESKVALRSVFHGTAPIEVAKSQKDLDYEKYLKRAGSKDSILAEMASENMERVRNGVWHVTELVALTQDQELKMILDDIATLSFELAAMKLQTATNPLLTAEIRSGWIAKLQSRFY